jgi:2-dehydro-3-deoxygalactonokinase
VRLVDPADFRVIAEEHSGMGIREAHVRWKKRAIKSGSERVIDSGSERVAVRGTEEAERVDYYLAIVGELIGRIAGRSAHSLQGIPVIMSGMASSSAGVLELPYRSIPFHLHTDIPVARFLETGNAFSHSVLLISGLRKADDVMRGEETQLIGCWQMMKEADGLYIFPGTHSKHIHVRDHSIIDFTTYMTGEFFDLLSEKSLLSGSVQGGKVGGSAADEVGWTVARGWTHFQQGVRDAAGANLLHAAFQVRVNDLFGLLSRRENFYYLSGLLIGAELQGLAKNDADRIYLCCGQGLKDHYEKALEVMDVCKRVHIFPGDWIDTAVVRGHFRIFNQCMQ